MSSEGEARANLDTHKGLFRTLLQKLAEEHDREVQELSEEVKHLRTNSSDEAAATAVHVEEEETEEPPSDDSVLDEHSNADASMEQAGSTTGKKQVSISDVKFDFSADQADASDEETLQEAQDHQAPNGGENTLLHGYSATRLDGELAAIKIHEVWESCEDALMGAWSSRFTFVLKITPKTIRMSEGRISGFMENVSVKHSVFYLLFCNFLPLFPTNQFKVLWDLSAMLFIIYDVIFIPMLAFDLPDGEGSFVGICDWCCICFWTLDLPLNFMVGYYSKDGKVVMSMMKIARRYVKGWFCADLLIIGTDWLTVSMRFAGTDGAGLARLGKIMRVARSMRTVRLLRLMKLRQFMGIVYEIVESEWMSLMLGTFMNLLTLIGVNHGVACLWFWLGSKTTSQATWVQMYGFADAPWDTQYVASLHWSLTQFTAASTPVTATNPGERLFSVIVLLFAIVAFSSFVSGITSAMTRLRTINSHNFAQSILLNKFLRQNKISRDLSARVTRYVQLLQSQHEAYLDANKVEYLKLLSGPLNIELQWERYMRVLKPHPFFHKCSNLGQAAMHHLCYTAVSSNFYARQDVLFDSGAPCEKMYFPQNGWLFYRRPPGFKGTPKYVVLSKGQWFAKLHCGLLGFIVAL